MKSVHLFVLVAAVMIASTQANELLGKAIRSCKKQFPKSEARTLPDFDLSVLTRDDKCYLLCIMSAQKLIHNGSFNVDALEFTLNNQKMEKCAASAEIFETRISANLPPNYSDALRT